MRLYLAAPWADRDLARRLADDLEADGHTITLPWWDHPVSDDAGELQHQAEEDYDGVRSAEVFVLLNSQKSEGKATELGMALVYHMPIIIVGERKPGQNIFHFHHRVVWVESFGGLLDELSLLRDRPHA